MSLRPSERAEAVDAEEGRRQREDNMVEIRKTRREENKPPEEAARGDAGRAALPPQPIHSTAALEKKWEEIRRGEDHVAPIRDFRAKIESELSSICEGMTNSYPPPLPPSGPAAQPSPPRYMVS